ncbi:hypothetical protein ICW_04864 [Bacillus wiedmannii]|nr:hypothetical protein ICW_04864 [Bacillus wiedmannii]
MTFDELKKINQQPHGLSMMKMGNFSLKKI